MMTAPVSRKRLLGAILAGGRASRMGGRDKGLIEIAPGLTLVEHLLDQFARAGIDEVVVSAVDASPYGRLGRAVVPDLRPDAGPLGGIESVLAWSARRAGLFDAVLFLPCDLPGITAREIAALADAFAAGRGRILAVETGKGFFQPLCCVVHNDALADIAALLDAGQRGVGTAWRGMGAAAVHFDDPAPFANINTPDDLERWKTSGRESV